MIPDNIQKEHLLQAIAEIDRAGVPTRRQSRRYDLFYRGKAYPPKLVVRTAQRLAGGATAGKLAGVRAINDFLTRQGFTIVLKPAALLVEAEPAIEYSEWVLQQLLAYRETHPDFYFLTRTDKKRDLLEAGHWLPGTDYLHVALIHGKSGHSATQSVGFQIDYASVGHPQASFIIRFKRERRPAVLAFYRALLEKLVPYGMVADNPTSFVLLYGEDILAAMNLFLERDVPIFQALLQEFDLKETLGIRPKNFTRKLSNVLLLQEEGPAYKKSRLARLCWNTNGWIMPSGPTGKSQAPTSLESLSGFGLEEWLLNLDKILIDGYHYGFLQPVNREWPAHTGKKYAIRLYTRNSADQQSYWIGELTSVEVIDPAKAKLVEKAYRKNGWLDAMGDQLTRLGLDRALLIRPPQAIGALFNVRFLPEDVSVYPELQPFSPQEETEMRDDAYSFLKTPGTLSAGLAAGFRFRASTPPGNLPEAIVRTFQHRTVEHPYLHGKIQAGLYKWLKEQHGPAQVAYEQPTGAGGSRIDLAVRFGPQDYTFYEIKTFNSLLMCIRVAIGQLLEYAFFPAETKASRLVIVSYHRPEKPVLQYLAELRDRTGLPVYYGYFDLESGELEL